jgi:NAD(P)-dependent dehydrogenase (short-subunit alcohol dehydrogenase family)
MKITPAPPVSTKGGRTLPGPRGTRAGGGTSHEIKFVRDANAPPSTGTVKRARRRRRSPGNKVWLVTQAGTPIGRETVLQLAAPGSAIVLTHTGTPDLVMEVAGECGRLGAKTLVVAGDTTKNDACVAIAKATRAAFGERLDGVLHFPGSTLFSPTRSVDAVNAEDFMGAHAMDVIAGWQLTRALAPLLTAARGSVVLASCSLALYGTELSAPYTVSEAALRALAARLNDALPDVDVNAVCPADIDEEWNFINGFQDERFTSSPVHSSLAQFAQSSLIDIHNVTIEDIAESLVLRMVEPEALLRAHD